jgi:hypothetical protein
MATSEVGGAALGPNGVGTAAAPKLIAIATKYDSPKLEALFRVPTDKMTSGGMQAVDLKAEEMKALISYLQSLK